MNFELAQIIHRRQPQSLFYVNFFGTTFTVGPGELMECAGIHCMACAASGGTALDIGLTLALAMTMRRESEDGRGTVRQD